MIVKSTVSALWSVSPSAFAKAEDWLVAFFSSLPKRTEIFFRADDIGVPGNNCQRMMELFREYHVPLHMAVTPAWLSSARWDILKAWGGGEDIWCWHQHGWRHVNHQTSGKKGEFGTDRSKSAKMTDIARGRVKLESLMGDDFRPVFTPPWNRFDIETGETLVELGFSAVSRSAGEQKKVPLSDALPDIPINVDLHTRSESDSDLGMDALFAEFKSAAQSGRIGVMLHHQRMDGAAIAFLAACLRCAANNSSLVFLRMDQL